jgi:DNA polymerase-3 subunit delta
MKLAARDVAAYARKPDASKTGVLIYGADAMRVSLRRQELIAALIGPQGEDEMRLDRMSGSDLRSDPARLLDGIKAQGMFPGQRVVFVEDASDACLPAVDAALTDWSKGDAQIIVTAGALRATSKLRKAFEGHSNAYAVGIYDDPPSRDEIEATLKRAGLNAVSSEAASDLQALARALDPGDFAQTVERMALYKLDDPDPLSSDEIALLAPASMEAVIDDVLNIVAEARAPEIGPVMARLRAQGVQPVGLCINATRHFRALLAAAAHPGGAAEGIGRLRPPVYGPRRDRMVRQAQNWGAARLEQALGLLVDTDRSLRSASSAPAMEIMERALIRLAMMGKR